MSELLNLSNALSALAASVAPRIIAVEGADGRQVSGFIWRTGLAVTAHEVLEGEDEAEVLLADGSVLKAAHSATGSYMPHSQDEPDLYDPHQFGPDLSRDFPGLRVWLTLKFYGAARYRAALLEKRALTLEACERVAAIPHIVIDAAPQLSLFAFHVAWPGSTLAEQNTATHELLERVIQRGKVMLSGFHADGRFMGRVCILSFRTRRDRVETCIEHLAEETAAVVRCYQ